MQINEIYTEKGIQEFVEHLEKYGEVHSGSFSYVYAPKGKDYVYKAWTHDPAWEAYLELVLSSSNPYFPKIEKVKSIPIHLARDKALANTKVKIAKIEKLYTIKPANTIICKRSKLYNLDIFSAIEYGTTDKILQACEISKEDQQKHALLFSTIDQLSELIDSNPLFKWDSNYSNILMRKDGHIVFSDPIGTKSPDWKNNTLVDYGYENTKAIYGKNTATTFSSAAEVQNAYPNQTASIIKEYFPLFNKIGVLASLSQSDFDKYLSVCPKDNDIIFDFILSDSVTRKRNNTKFVQSFTKWYKKRFHELEQQWFNRNLKYDWQDYIYTLDDFDTKMGDAAFEYIEQGRKENGYESLPAQ